MYVYYEYFLQTSWPGLPKKSRSKENSKHDLGFKSITYHQRSKKLNISEEQF